MNLFYSRTGSKHAPPAAVMRTGRKDMPVQDCPEKAAGGQAGGLIQHIPEKCLAASWRDIPGLSVIISVCMTAAGNSGIFAWPLVSDFCTLNSYPDIPCFNNMIRRSVYHVFFM